MHLTAFTMLFFNIRAFSNYDFLLKITPDSLSAFADDQMALLLQSINSNNVVGIHFLKVMQSYFATALDYILDQAKSYNLNLRKG